MGKVKAHCAKYNKWFALDIDDSADGGGQIVNFVDLTEKQAEGISTDQSATTFFTSPNLRPCMRCGARKAGTCNHIESLGRCKAEYSYQCLFCNQLKINLGKSNSRFTEWAGTNLIPGAETDKYGNARGSQYDLAKEGSFEGFKIIILCLYTGEGILDGIQDPMRAMRMKGFEVQLYTDATPSRLERLLEGACQLWVVSDQKRHLNDEHLSVIRRFYQNGHGLYLLGDNEPFYADVNYLGEALLGTTMYGNTTGDRVISVQKSAGAPGIIPGHPISTGIVNLYEGITIATVRTTSSVKPLAFSSSRNTVTAILDENGCRALMDGGFTRLYHKWNTAGTSRLIVNMAAWLANADNDAKREISFT